MKKERPKSILITGASTGIGYETARAFHGAGYTVFGSVRSTNDAVRLQKEMGERFHPLLFDVTDDEAIQKARKEVEDILGAPALGGLVNNAGIAIGGPLMHLSVEAIEKQFSINVLGAIRVTQVFLPLLGARENHNHTPGRIINISSASGKIASPFMASYSATKHALEGISHGLRRELQLYGIDVIIIGPGPVVTPIWDKGVDIEPFRETIFYPAIKRFIEVFVRDGKTKGLPAEYLGKKVLEVFEKRKPKTRYAYVPQKLKNWTIPRLLPPRVLDYIFSRILGLAK